MNGVFRVGEIIRSGNTTAKVRSYNLETQFITFSNVNGVLENGDYIVGDDSGASGILNGYVSGEDLDESTNFDELENFITTDKGEFIATDAHFDGTPSQEYQTKYILTK